MANTGTDQEEAPTAARYDPTDHEFDFPRVAGSGSPAPRTGTQALHAKCDDLRSRHFALQVFTTTRLVDAECRIEQLEATVEELRGQVAHAARLLHRYINQDCAPVLSGDASAEE